MYSKLAKFVWILLWVTLISIYEYKELACYLVLLTSLCSIVLNINCSLTGKYIVCGTMEYGGYNIYNTTKAFMAQLSSSFEIDWMRIINGTYTTSEFLDGIQWRLNNYNNYMTGAFSSQYGVYMFYQTLSSSASVPSTYIYFNYWTGMSFHSFFSPDNTWDFYHAFVYLSSNRYLYITCKDTESSAPYINYLYGSGYDTYQAKRAITYGSSPVFAYIQKSSTNTSKLSFCLIYFYSLHYWNLFCK